MVLFEELFTFILSLEHTDWFTFPPYNTTKFVLWSLNVKVHGITEDY